MNPGSYKLICKKQGDLHRVVDALLNDGENSINLGKLKVGDINGDNEVTILDFSALVYSFNKSNGEEGYNTLGDFNGDNQITILGFSLMVTNFNQARESLE